MFWCVGLGKNHALAYHAWHERYRLSEDYVPIQAMMGDYLCVDTPVATKEQIALFAKALAQMSEIAYNLTSQ